MNLEVDYLVPTTVPSEHLVLEVHFIADVVKSRVEFPLGRAETVAVTDQVGGHKVSFKLFFPFLQTADLRNDSLDSTGILQVRPSVPRARPGCPCYN